MDGDFLLVMQMKNGNDRAVEAFVRKYYPSVLKYCCLHSGNPSDGEDLTQEVFVRFFRSFGDYHHCGKALNYLYTIARNLCRDGVRRELSLEDMAEPTQETDLDEKIAVRSALLGLPEAYREAAVLYYFHGWSQREIAGMLGIGLPLVKYRLSRAKELLRQALKEEID